jgi:hypothetical protein
MRRITLLAAAAALAVVPAAPGSAEAAHPCVAEPGVQTCLGLVSELGGPTYDQVYDFLKHPYDCVQDCDGPPPA